MKPEAVRNCMIALKVGFRCILLGALLAPVGILFAQGNSTYLIRNSQITSLDPLSPPLESLFDPSTGQLLGTEIQQTWQYTSYHEDALSGGDGPLVLYQLSDPNQTLFVSRIGDTIFFSSYAGRCREVGEAELTVAINNVPQLRVEYDHAVALYGIGTYPGGVVCEDQAGTLSVASLPHPLGTYRSVSLLFLRDVLDDPASYIVVTRASSQDFFNLNGGLRYDGNDPNSPHFQVLDSQGNISPTMLLSSSPTSCADVNRDYQNCLVFDPFWTAVANGLVEEMHLADLSDPDGPFLHCFAAAVGLPTLAACTVRGAVASAALLYSGAGNLNQTLCRSVLPPGGVECLPPPDSDPQCAFAGSCTLDEGQGFAYCTYPRTSPGTCSSTRDCGGGGYCTDDLCWTDPQPPEVCDNYDNDCDGALDENLGTTTCGVGACQVTTANCIGGIPQTCMPEAPSTEICDNIDNDCDGTLDGFSTTCGVGACAASGTCTSGVDSCTSGTPAPEICDGIDNDCDGTVDEGCETPCLPLPAGLVSWWTGDDSPSDYVGSNPTTLRNGVGFVPGQVGAAFLFDGINDYSVVLEPSLQAAADASFTVDFWMKTSFSTTINQGVVAHSGAGAIGNAASLQILLSGAERPFAACQTMVGGSLVSWPDHLGIMLMEPNFFPSVILCSDAPFNDGVYHHVAVSFDGASRTLTGYFDGQPSGFVGADFNGNPAGTLVGPGQVQKADFAGVNWSLPLYFGTTYQRFFPLELDEVDFFNRALSSNEIQAIFAAGSAGKCK